MSAASRAYRDICSSFGARSPPREGTRVGPANEAASAARCQARTDIDGLVTNHHDATQMSSDGSPAAGETIGQRLKRLRLDRGLSQRELAAPGVSYAYISRIEAGTRQPSVKALRRLASNLGVSADYLETGSHLDPGDDRELRLSDLELAMRLGGSGEIEQ